MGWFEKEPLDFTDCIDDVIKWNLIACGGEHDYSPEKIELYQNLVIEEGKEALEAFDQRDKQSFLKELIDYVVVSCYWKFLCKARNEYYDMEYNLNGMIIDLQSDLEQNKLEAGYESGWGCTALSKLNADVIGAFKEVNRSNFSKFVPFDQIADENEAMLVAMDIEEKSNGRYRGVRAIHVGDYVVFKDENGKIMKPSTYSEADVSGFIY